MLRGPSWLCKWFHGGYLANVFAEGMKVALFGKVEFDSYAGELTMLHPEFEILSGDDEDGEARCTRGRMVPIYEGVGKLTTRVLRVLSRTACWKRWIRSKIICRRILRQSLKLPDLLDRRAARRISRRPMPTCGC